MNQLLSSSNCERKSVALSILGSLCGLSSFKPRSKKRDEKLNDAGEFANRLGDDDEDENWQNESNISENMDAENYLYGADDYLGG